MSRKSISSPSSNACMSLSFSDAEGIESVKKKLEFIRPGILRSLELEKITLYGFETALNKASDWCWGKRKRNLKHKGTETTYYVSL